MSTHQFKVAMTCTGCSGSVERVLGKLGDQIQNVRIDLDNRLVFVTSSLSSDKILETIKKTGLESSYVGVAAN